MSYLYYNSTMSSWYLPDEIYPVTVFRLELIFYKLFKHSANFEIRCWQRCALVKKEIDFKTEISCGEKSSGLERTKKNRKLLSV